MLVLFVADALGQARWIADQHHLVDDAPRGHRDADVLIGAEPIGVDHSNLDLKAPMRLPGLPGDFGGRPVIDGRPESLP